jgi:hypothetical protein
LRDPPFDGLAAVAKGALDAFDDADQVPQLIGKIIDSRRVPVAAARRTRIDISTACN